LPLLAREIGRAWIEELPTRSVAVGAFTMTDRAVVDK